MSRVRSLPIAAAAVVLTMGVLLVAPPASAGQVPAGRAAARGCHAPRCFGAISFNKRTGVAGLADDRDGRHKAIRLAQRSCRAKSERQFGSPAQCTAAGSVQNGCMAVAFRVQDDVIVEWTTKFGHTKREAKSAAHDAVAGPGDRYFAAWLCTTRSY